MKKFLLSLATVLCATSFASAAEVTFEFKTTNGTNNYGLTPAYSGNNTGYIANNSTATEGDIILTLGGGTNNWRNWSDGLRAYGKNNNPTLKVSGASEGITISEISIKLATALTITADSGTMGKTTSTKENSWTGSAADVTFKLKGANAAIQTLTITYTKAGAVEVDAPVITPAEGVYVEAQEVTITAAADNKVYYTLDGSKPTDASTLYTAPFTVSEATTIKAIAVDPDDNASSVATTIIAIAEGAKGDGTETAPYNAIAANAGALAGMTNSVYIEGIIVSVKSIDTGSNGNAEYYISADGTEKDQLYIYRGYGLNGAKFTSAEDLKPGMKVTVNGSLSTYQNVPQIGTGSKIVELDTTGVEDIEINENAPVEYYNLQGVRVENPANGLYIMRQGDKVVKVIK